MRTCLDQDQPEVAYHAMSPAKEHEVSHSTENSFSGEFRQFLEGLLQSMPWAERLSDEQTAMISWREGKGSLQFDQEQLDKYRELLRHAQRAVAPQDDLSRATIDRALQDAMFAVVEAERKAKGGATEQIELAVEAAKEVLEGRPESFTCWIEVHGFDLATLPDQYGSTAFVPFGQSHLEQLDAIDQTTKAPIPQASAQHMLGSELSVEGRTIAVQQVHARDSESAIALAIREVAATLDCLNCFRDIIPYNRAALRVANSQQPTGSAIRFSYTATGKFRNSPKSEIPWEYSMERLRQLYGRAGQAMERLHELLARNRRTEVEELLVRAARWIGRAAVADTAEDCFLYSWIPIDCMLKPVPRRDKILLGRLEWILSDFSDISDFGHLWGLRNALVHDGRLEIPEFDKRMLQSLAVHVLVRLLVDIALRSIVTLSDLDQHYKLRVEQE